MQPKCVARLTRSLAEEQALIARGLGASSNRLPQNANATINHRRQRREFVTTF